MAVGAIAGLVFGLALLVIGADLLVRGASRLATVLGVSPLVIGLTVVAFGTSSPELAVSIQAGLDGRADIALGNVVGSNIFNVLFVLGVSAAVAPLFVSRQLVRMDVPIMIGVSGLVWLMALDGRISRLDGGLLFAGLIAYTVVLAMLSRRETAAARAADEAGLAAGEAARGPTPGSVPNGARAIAGNAALVVAGLALLVIGSRFLVDAAVTLAAALGVSELVIGLTIVAAGTSLPELATSVLASLRGERDIAIGNIVGSNLFNLLGILGLSALILPDGVVAAPAAIAFDIPVMTLVALACLPIFFTGFVIARWEALVLLLGYVAYTAYVVVPSF